MENIGALAILMAFCVAIYAAIASAVGRARHKPFLVASGGRAVYAVWGLMTLAAAILVRALLTSDFRFAYVAEHTNRAMPTHVQVRRLVGRAGRLAAVLELAAFHLRRGRGLHQPPQASRHDAVGRRRARHGADLLPDAEQFRRQPLPDAGGG